MDRRKFIVSAWAAGASALAAPAIALPLTKAKIRIGYLHTVAVDEQIWLADHLGAWARNGLDPQFSEFKTGIELFNAMAAGQIDMLATGAVISNFPARGQGKMFLANSIEYATAQLWVREDMGVHQVADLRGKKVATTIGTTAHVFLDNALRENSMTASDIDLAGMPMPQAVDAFIKGDVPAVALWVPFNITVREKLPQAKMLLDAGVFYPSAAVVDGWAASNTFHAENKPVLARVIRAWIEANDMLMARTNESLGILHDKYYPNVPPRDIKEQFGAMRVFPTAVWRRLYGNGTITEWLQQVTDFYARATKIQNPVPAEQYFDPTIFLSVVKG
jgi:ABC-type nitrate/sulfonate/bicarbonate transport system substrate-binding protein